MSTLLFDEMWEVAERIAQAPHLLICLDYDGTLAPFEESPGGVYLSQQMQRLLRSLAGHESATLVILSGRERNDLQKRVGIENIVYAGNHGLEISGPGLILIEPTALKFWEPLQELASTLAPSLKAIPGAFVEDKGLTLTIHYRAVSESRHEEVQRTLEDALRRTGRPFVLTAGDKVFEIRPPVAWNKGIAVQWIRQQLDEQVLPIYLGDDLTDEDAFIALSDAITIKVGESPQTAALYRIENQEEVRRFLEWVDGLLYQKPVQAAAMQSS
jgi:trehalose-phosphatase